MDFVACPSGKVPVGGGVDGGGVGRVLGSFPYTISGQTGWYVEVYNPSVLISIGFDGLRDPRERLVGGSIAASGQLHAAPGLANGCSRRSRSVPPSAVQGVEGAHVLVGEAVSKIAAFSMMRSRWIDFGITTAPRWIPPRSMTWAGVRSARRAISTTVALSSARSRRLRERAVGLEDDTTLLAELEQLAPVVKWG